MVADGIAIYAKTSVNTGLTNNGQVDCLPQSPVNEEEVLAMKSYSRD